VKGKRSGDRHRQDLAELQRLRERSQRFAQWLEVSKQWIKELERQEEESERQLRALKELSEDYESALARVRIDVHGPKGRE
jgi:hypothetical protein